MNEDLREGWRKRRAQLEATGARIEQRAGRNLFLAIGSGLLFGAVFVLALFLATPLFLVLVVVIVSITLVELATAYRQSGRRVPRVGVVLSGALVVLSTWFFGVHGLLIGLVGGLVIIGMWRFIEGVVTEVPPKTLLRDVSGGLFSVIYVAFLASFTLLLIAGQRGEWWVFTLIATVVVTDIGAYAAGVTFGKHKMTPRISPNKTWEGLGGALLFGVSAAVLCSVFLLQLPWWTGLILGVLVVGTATVGDLTESLIKRNLGVKDMSSWIPGHGGFLDRLDSILPSTVPVYLVFLVSGGA